MAQLIGMGSFHALTSEIREDLQARGMAFRSFDDLEAMIEHIREQRDEIRAVLVDPEALAPLEVAQAVARADSSIEVLLIQASNRAADRILAQAVAPFLGPQIRGLPVAPGAEMVAAIQAGAERTLARRVDSSVTGSEDVGGVQEQIRARRNAEAHYRQSQRFLESIIEHVPDMLFVKEAEELRFVRFNKAGEDLLGFARSEMYGKNDHDFFPPEEANFFTSKDREVLEGKKLVEIPEEPIQTRHRGLRWLHTKKIPLIDDTGRPRYLVGISQDVTEQKLAREELARAAQELARSNKELEDFAYIASHDLQEPLRKIRAFGDRLESSARPKLDDSEIAMLDRMQKAGERMQRLIDDLLRYSRITRSMGDHEAVDLSTVLEDVLEDLKPRIDAVAATVRVDPLPVVIGHRTQMHQLFQNLVGNALKFHRAGHPPNVRIEYGACEGDIARISVIDDGIGFDEKYLDRIFSPFQRLHGREDYPGTGIGLAVCRRVADRSGGAITATSRPGEGSTFRVELRRAPQDP